MKLLKDPFLHFFIIGALLFATYLWINPESMADDTEIVVDAGRIEQLRSRFERTWKRAPSDEELKGLIDNFIVEEILYRQALAMGLDDNDSVIRRRLRQKLEFLTMEAMHIEEPSADELQQYLEQNPELFQTSARFSFEQIYINTDQPIQNWKAQVATIQERLQKGEQVTGSRSLIPQTFELATDFEIDRVFGHGFAASLAKQPLDQWSDPLVSGLGTHFVRINTYQPATTPPLMSVEKEVLREWRNTRNQKMKAELLEQLKAKYNIVIESASQSLVEGKS
ncbi:MAG: peptidyl-prolyl cis-trans isomerase [Ketobacter sp.]|nr:MAG: peptidyl-prolyl cis-trans isomerase [Ketobacter sp.]